jgi:hypothetical protein
MLFHAQKFQRSKSTQKVILKAKKDHTLMVLFLVDMQSLDKKIVNGLGWTHQPPSLNRRQRSTISRRARIPMSKTSLISMTPASTDLLESHPLSP